MYIQYENIYLANPLTLVFNIYDIDELKHHTFMKNLP